MLGRYQQSCLRIELAATAAEIEASLVQPKDLKTWLWPQQLSGLSGQSESQPLSAGQEFESGLGPLTICHKVEHRWLHQAEEAQPGGIRFLLSGAVDGFHEWQWGEGWVQSRIEGRSLLPISLGQSASLFRLRQYLTAESPFQAFTQADSDKV